MQARSTTKRTPGASRAMTPSLLCAKTLAMTISWASTQPMTACQVARPLAPFPTVLRKPLPRRRAPASKQQPVRRSLTPRPQVAPWHSCPKYRFTPQHQALYRLIAVFMISAWPAISAGRSPWVRTTRSPLVVTCRTKRTSVQPRLMCRSAVTSIARTPRWVSAPAPSSITSTRLAASHWLARTTPSCKKAATAPSK